MRMREALAGALAAFALNWAWENAQAPLYRGYTGFADHVWTCTVATFGDVLIVALIFCVVAVAWRDPEWHHRASPARYAVAVAAGIVIAIAIESWALTTGRWLYGAMPLIPYTDVGLVPILQMILIPSLVFVLMRHSAATDQDTDR